MTKEISPRIEYHIVDPEICDQIRFALDALKKAPEFDLLRQHQIYHFLRAEANKHSVALELPNGHKVRSGKAKLLALENLQSGQEYFSSKFRGSLNEELIRGTAYLIAPNLGNPVQYRGEHSPTTRSQGENSIIYPQNVSEEMPEFIAKNNALRSPVEKALHAHFEIARIHPFFDGNGRLARLVQNGILDFGALPPIAIEPFERQAYMGLLQEAERSFREYRELKKEQSLFYNYLALKLRDSLMTAQRKISLH